MTTEGEKFLGIAQEENASGSTENKADNTNASSGTPEGNGLKSIGGWLMLVGILLGAFFLFIFSTTVKQSYEVHNIGLLNTKLAGVIVSLGIAVIGSIFYIGGVIKDAMK